MIDTKALDNVWSWIKAIGTIGLVLLGIEKSIEYIGYALTLVI